MIASFIGKKLHQKRGCLKFIFFDNIKCNTKIKIAISVDKGSILVAEKWPRTADHTRSGFPPYHFRTLDGDIVYKIYTYPQWRPITSSTKHL